MTATTTPDDVSTRRLPPVDRIATVVIALVVTGGIDMAARLPRRPPLGVPSVLLALAALLLASDVVLLARIPDFAWDVFFLVAKWALAAYLVIAGMLEYVFVLDHTRGGVLVVLTLTLAVFAVDIPMLLAFSVARYQPGPSSRQA